MTDFIRAATLEDMAQAYSDTFKEVHGVRPQHTEGWTFEDYAAKLQGLQIIADEDARREKAERLAAINVTLKVGAPDFETAQRWLKQAGTHWEYV